MKRNFKFSPGEYYHIYNRGTDKRDIFKNEIDQNRFMSLLYLCNRQDAVDIRQIYSSYEGRSFVKILDFNRGEMIVDIGAYCLMPNHFHLLIREKEEGGVSKFMKKLSTGYSMYFNKKHQRTGGLFEGRFKAMHVSKDTHLKYLFSYIHLNPVKLIDPKWKEKGITDKEKIRKYLGNYKYSSYLDYIGQERREMVILNKQEFPKYFNNDLDFSDFINFWLSFNKEKF